MNPIAKPAALAAALFPALAAAGDRWPDYRGPGQDGRAPEAEVPLEWSEEAGVRWKTAIRGRGWSSPVVWDGTAWLTSATAEGTELYVLGVDVETGEVLHDRTVFEVEDPEPRNGLNSYASPSPVVEEGRVYAHFGTYGTACLDTETGATLWERRDLHCDHGEGPGSSPVLVGDHVVFHLDGKDVQLVVALEKATGKTAWKRERSADLDDLYPELRKAYSTPVVATVGGRPLLFSSGAQATAAYDPKTGEELWSVRHGGFSMSSRPLLGDGVIYLNTGFMKPELWAVRTDGEGDVTESGVAWTYGKNQPTMPSPVLVDGRIYTISDDGIATCLDAKTGERLGRRRMNGRYCASPVYAGGRLYFFDRDGRTLVVEPGPELEVLAESQLDAGFMASPAVVGDAFLLRTFTHLYRIEGK